jgi:S-adenosylmethionine-diacylgycerolhomoserine-N-methlytransferase
MASTEVRESMNRMYRYTRHVYDASRKYFLLGRDVLINNLNAQAGEHICEIGCGTARNLIKLAKKYPQAQFYGIDASDEMLKTAQQSMARSNVNVLLAQAYAQNFQPSTFGVDQFDKVVFSYALSIIPPWKESVDHALDVLKRGGEMHIVDFGPQDQMPENIRKNFFHFLSRFHVYYKPEIAEYFKKLESDKRGKIVALEKIHKGYAIRMVFRKA